MVPSLSQLLLLLRGRDHLELRQGLRVEQLHAALLREPGLARVDEAVQDGGGAVVGGAVVGGGCVLGDGQVVLQLLDLGCGLFRLFLLPLLEHSGFVELDARPPALAARLEHLVAGAVARCVHKPG